MLLTLPCLEQVRRESFIHTWRLAAVDGEPVKTNFYLVQLLLYALLAGESSLNLLALHLYCMFPPLSLAQAVSEPRSLCATITQGSCSPRRTIRTLRLLPLSWAIQKAVCIIVVICVLLEGAEILRA